VLRRGRSVYATNERTTSYIPSIPTDEWACVRRLELSCVLLIPSSVGVLDEHACTSDFNLEPGQCDLCETET
jgi:hypothetical protein